MKLNLFLLFLLNSYDTNAQVSVLKQEDFCSYPQPILADIEIDIGVSMIMVFADRFAMQIGNRNYGDIH